MAMLRLAPTDYLLTIAFLSTLLILPAHGEELENVLGEKWQGTLISISAQGELQFVGESQRRKMTEMRSWKRVSASLPPNPGKIVATGVQGMRLHLQELTFNGDAFECQLVSDISFKLPFDLVQAVCLEPGKETPTFREATEKPARDTDKVFVKVEKQIETINGLIAKLDGKELIVEVGGEKRTIPRERVHGFVLAQSSSQVHFSAILHTNDGSRIPANSLTLSDNKWHVAWLGGSESDVEKTQMQRIDFRPPGLLFLSDITPVVVKEQTLFTPAAPWQRDRSVGGRPLQIAGVSYERGLGVHARSELTFEIPSDYKYFLAVIGIDDEVQRDRASATTLGNCEFIVLADGREIYRQTLRGGTAPEALRLELKNAKRLTLLVEVGDDFDFADHANWCDARLLKQIP
jgi:hypothetical protein